jgi:hypothetical protein
VHRANDAIYNIPIKSPVSEEKKARLVAEARFLRAFHYYRLNELWHGVPYYDVPILVTEATKGQETEEFIWERIIEDLTACINEPHFPNNNFTAGRVTKGAAYALRGKVYMQQGKWQDAIRDFERVGAMGYGLAQVNYKALFTEAHERSSEMIFSVENMQGYANFGSIAQQYLGTRAAQGSNWGDHRITPFAVELYENSDSTPFNWDDYIPGYSSLPIAARQVYFLRDTLRANGTPLEPSIAGSIPVLVRARLATLEGIMPGISAHYLPYGNEARVKTAYADRDPRLAANVITPYAEFLGVNEGTGGTQNFTHTLRWPYRGNDGVRLPDNTPVGDLRPDRQAEFEYFQRKFVYEGFNGTTFDRTRGGIDDPMIRYADVLLMWAEALVEINQLTNAMDKVAQVRNRVGMPTLASNFADQATARNYVRDERRREMLGEGGAYFDELRWGTLKETKFPAGASTKQVWGIPGGGAAFRWPDVYNRDQLVWPIPRGEIERNPNLKPTPGWTY